MDDGFEYNVAYKTSIGWRTTRFNILRREAQLCVDELRANGFKVRAWRRPVPPNWERVKL